MNNDLKHVQKQTKSTKVLSHDALQTRILYLIENQCKLDKTNAMCCFKCKTWT